MERTGTIDLPPEKAGQLVAAGLRHVYHVGDEVRCTQRLTIGPVRHAPGQVRSIVWHHDQVGRQIRLGQVEGELADMRLGSSHAHEAQHTTSILIAPCSVARQDRVQRCTPRDGRPRVVADSHVARGQVDDRAVAG
ncbi:hypothetical protein D3C73_1231140 [compost metagenome]